MKQKLLQASVLLLLPLLSVAAFYYLKLYEYVNFNTLQHHYTHLQLWKNQHPLLAFTLFLFIYTVITLLALPLATLLKLTGGFLFGIALGTSTIIISATFAASVIFLIARYGLAPFFQKKSGPNIQRIQQAFQNNAFTYLLILRLLPVSPFFTTHIAAGLMNMRLMTFISATALGLIPCTLIYTALGQRLSLLISNQTDVNLSLTPYTLLLFLGLALMALSPLLFKKFNKTLSRSSS